MCWANAFSSLVCSFRFAYFNYQATSLITKVFRPIWLMSNLNSQGILTVFLLSKLWKKLQKITPNVITSKFGFSGDPKWTHPGFCFFFTHLMLHPVGAWYFNTLLTKWMHFWSPLSHSNCQRAPFDRLLNYSNGTCYATLKHKLHHFTHILTFKCTPLT